MTNKKIISIDFDGVLHANTSGWQAIDVIPYGPVPGAMAFLKALVEDGRFDVCVVSDRCSEWIGLDAIGTWLRKHLVEAFGEPGEDIADVIDIVASKPAASLTIDEYSFHEDGTWPDLDKMAAPVPWNKKAAAAQEEPVFTSAEIGKFEGLIEGYYDGPRTLSEDEAPRFEAFVDEFGTESLKRSMFKVTFTDETPAIATTHSLTTDEDGRPSLDGKPAVAVDEMPVPFIPIGPIEDDGGTPPRYYIPLAGGWEVQTKGSGSTVRLGNSASDTAFGKQITMTTAGYDAEHLETMARGVHAATRAMQSEIERLRGIVDRAGALASQSASSEMIRETLAQSA